MAPHPCCDSPRVRTPRLRPVALLCVAMGIVLVACGDPYLHTNPYDPVYPMQMTITGPDTLFSLGEVGQYTVQTMPAWSDTGFVWGIGRFTDYFIQPRPPCGTQIATGDTALKGNGAGEYHSILPPLDPYSFTIPISVSVGTIDTTTTYFDCGVFVFAHYGQPRHTAYKAVVITQRVTRIQLRCPDTHACAPLAAGDSAFIWADGFDAGGSRIAALTSGENPATGNPAFPYLTNDTAVIRAQKTNNPVATYLSRDTTIARATPIGIRVARVTPVSAGTTWVVATRGGLHDSLQIVVH